jgi:hypothetical protein
VRARRKPVPAVHVDPDENRLEEKRKTLDREPEPENPAERGSEIGPEQTHLEAEDRPRDHADGEERHHDPRPTPRQRAIQRVAGAQPARFGEEHQHRERDAERDERDVHRKRERLHLPCLVKVLLMHGHQRIGEHADHALPPTDVVYSLAELRAEPVDPSQAVKTTSARRTSGR